jgi:hypothetical protein
MGNGYWVLGIGYWVLGIGYWVVKLLPIPCSLFPIPYSLFPIPYSLFPVPCSLFPVPCSLFPVPFLHFDTSVFSRSSATSSTTVRLEKPQAKMIPMALTMSHCGGTKSSLMTFNNRRKPTNATVI